MRPSSTEGQSGKNGTNRLHEVAFAGRPVSDNVILNVLLFFFFFLLKSSPIRHLVLIVTLMEAQEEKRAEQGVGETPHPARSGWHSRDGWGRRRLWSRRES